MAGYAREVALADSTIRLAATGDTVAFARIVAAFHGDMSRVAYVVADGDAELAADAVQSGWAGAWRKLGTLREPGCLKAWLVSIAANEARQASRKQHRRAVIEIDVGSADPATSDPADRAWTFDLDRALRHLSPDDRALLALRYEAGLDSSEIGALAGRPAGTVRWQLSRLLERLRKELADA
jgi:RNA polymerase sigma-70 factor (ECF subfamily)